MAWSHAILLGFLSGIISLIVFLLLEVIMGDVLHDLLAGMPNSTYSSISLIVFSGMMLILASNFIVNLLYTNLMLEPKIIANILSFLISYMIMIFMANVGVIIQYPGEFSTLDLYSLILKSADIIAIFAVYVLPDPISFWIITNIIYNIILIFFMKLFYVKKPKKEVKKKNARQGIFKTANKSLKKVFRI